MRNWIKLAALAFAALLLAAAIVLARYRNGVQVTVTNVGATAISEVVIMVTGATYELGRLDPGSDGAVYVSPTGETHVEVTWTDALGQECSGVIDCYFEGSGYHGSASMQIDGAAVKGTAQDIDIGYL